MVQPRPLPHRAEAEAAVLGGVLLRGRDALHEVMDVVSDADFYVPGNQALFRAMIALADRGEPIDVVTLEAQLRAVAEFNLVGGIEGLARLGDRYATSHNIAAHAELVRQAASVRRLVVTAREIAAEGMDDLEDSRAFIEESEQRVFRANERGRRSSYRVAKDLVLEAFRGITDRQNRSDPITGVPSGFFKLDDMTAGLQPGDLLIIAARPSMGKTAFALNIAQHACIPATRHLHLPIEEQPTRHPVLFFSLEMGSIQLIERVLCSEARVDYAHLRRGGQMTQGDLKNLIAAAERVSQAKLYIDDSATASVLEIRARARRWREDRSIFPDVTPGLRPPIGLIVVDYMQLCRGSRRHDSREQEISEISRGLKALAKELQIPVVALSQLNRAADSRADHRPQLSDLRESGAIEQDADVIMFIYREERYLAGDASEQDRARVENKAEVIVSKQRNGPVGTVPLTFVKKHTRFENPADDFG